MRQVLHALVIVSLLCGLSACGNKGKLKTPTQVQAMEAKKEHRKAKQDAAEPITVLESPHNTLGSEGQPPPVMQSPTPPEQPE